MIKRIEGHKEKNRIKLKRFEDAYDAIDMYEDRISKLDKVLNEKNMRKNTKKVAVKLININIVKFYIVLKLMV